MSELTDGIANWVVRNADFTGMRNGQMLMNSLPEEIYNVVTGTKFDPFHKEHMCEAEVSDWLENHVVFSSDGDFIGAFNGETILWEAN